MSRKNLFTLASLIMIASMLLAACNTATPTAQVITNTQVVVQTAPPVVQTAPPVVQTQIVEPTAVPTSASTRTGAWADSLSFTVQNSAEAAVTQLEAGEIDIYAYGVNNSKLFQKVAADPKLAYSNSFGSADEITYNVAKFTDGRLNPFSDAKIREATNWLIDRNQVVQEIFGGLAIPKFFPLVSAFADYARYVDTARKLENFYAYNPDKAKQVITDQMNAAGAKLGSDGKWTFNDKPVVLDFIIRTEDERKQIGDYFANQLETVGFTVNRMYKTRSEASPLWVQSDPAEGKWTLYTGGWITTAVSRDDGTNFSFYYTKNDYPIPLFQAYTNPPEFEKVALDLRNNNFKTMDERKTLFEQAMTMALQNSERVWIIDARSFIPRRADMSVASDLAGGVSGSQIYAETIRLNGVEGGVIRIAQPGLMVDPWNAIGGSNWIYDAMPQRATMDFGVIADPYTGINLPQRIESAEVVAKEGLPISKSQNYVTLKTAPSIEVPKDAWVDWDAKTQKFITAGDKFTSTATANVQVTVTYPKDLFTTIKWHDGSAISVGDFVFGMIMTFDPGKKDSKEFDESIGSTLDAFLAHFKGVKIVSTDPLTIQTWEDTWYTDAELNVNAETTWWPNYTYGPISWHAMAPQIAAVEAKKLAWSSDAADKEKVDWMSVISGPSIDILKGFLETLSKANTIPFEPTLGQFVKADEATARYANLNAWFTARNNLWLGTGPYYVYKVFPVEQTMTLQRFTSFPDPATKWGGFGAPKLATTAVDGPGQVATGTEAKFDVTVTDPSKNPYPTKEISGAKYLVFDGKGNLVASGEATPNGDGKFTVDLTADATKAFTSGSYKLEVAVSPIPVSVPAFGSFEFVVP